MRPVLFPSRLDDTVQKIRWGNNHWAAVRGGRATVEEADGIAYLAISLRNVGSGIAVLHGWRVSPDTENRRQTRPELEAFRPQQRDLYVPTGDVSFWQGAIRELDDPDRGFVFEAAERRLPLFIDLLYGDHEGGQRTISRFFITPRDATESDWIGTVVRHWNLDRHDPR
jgi:hypothetical protein